MWHEKKTCGITFAIRAACWSSSKILYDVQDPRLCLLEEYAVCRTSGTGLCCGSLDDGETESKDREVTGMLWAARRASGVLDLWYWLKASLGGVAHW